ncbi:MAG: hypothetical protein ACRDIB_09005 [Ardenticatenaceae bacterium]
MKRLLVLLLLLSALLGACGRATPLPAEETPTAEGEASPTAIASTPTEQVEPVEEPTSTSEPTEMPEPSATVEASVIPEPTVTADTTAAEEKEYAEFVNESLEKYDGALINLRERNAELDENITVYFNQNWRASITESVDALQETSAAIVERQPPERLTAFHEEMLALAAKVEEGAALVAEALETASRAKSREGRERLQEARELMEALPLDQLEP